MNLNFIDRFEWLAVPQVKDNKPLESQPYISSLYIEQNLTRFRIITQKTAS